MRKIKSGQYSVIRAISVPFLLSLLWSCSDITSSRLKEAFHNPPESAKPGVYWYFMDGNLSREGMTKDLESMKAAGISNLVFRFLNSAKHPGTP